MGSVSVPVSVTKKWGGGGGEIRKNIGKRWSGEGQKEDGERPEEGRGRREGSGGRGAGGRVEGKG